MTNVRGAPVEMTRVKAGQDKGEIRILTLRVRMTSVIGFGG
jgi:hypothetical protein